MLSSKDLIKISLDQGFVAAGISSPVLVTKSNVYLKNWLRSGYHAEMQWMTKNEEIRTNVLKSYPWVKSILVVADNYYLNHR
ncbi:MAG: epoxyqueuosine reductase, partial [Candidatus Marinimicrobia bacterium]|nr:epoxyqueuosine reductase [Candidatus Neomarinimicrobiota bacterium]